MFPRKTHIVVFLMCFITIVACCLSHAGVVDKYSVPSEVVAQMLQHPRFSVFIHPETEGRLPIVVQSDFVDPNLELILYGQPVDVVKDTKHQLVTNIFISHFQDGQVSLTYPIEGVKGIFDFTLEPDGTWLLKAINIREQ